MLFYYYKRDFLLIPSTYEETNFTPVLIDFYKELETQTTEWMQKKKKAESHIIEDETPPVIGDLHYFTFTNGASQLSTSKKT